GIETLPAFLVDCEHRSRPLHQFDESCATYAPFYLLPLGRYRLNYPSENFVEKPVDRRSLVYLGYRRPPAAWRWPLRPERVCWGESFLTSPVLNRLDGSHTPIAKYSVLRLSQRGQLSYSVYAPAPNHYRDAREQYIEI